MNPEQSESSPALNPSAAPQLPPPVETESNIVLAFGAGIGAALIGAVAWAVVTVITKLEIGWMAVGVGFIVGFAVGYFNPQGRTSFGYLGATLALFGCVVGNAFSILGFLSVQEHMSLLQVLGRV